jgi:2-polyprenyl-3-methyl-5-hydroxy-6-metoxy-1,4-benzoquinol methylase
VALSDQGYELKEELVRGCGADLRLSTLQDRQQFSDPSGVAAAAGVVEEAWALFGVLWPSARVLAEAMTRWEVTGRRILEVGCGLALASLVLHRRGADVVASDYHPLVPEFLKRNLALNGLPAMKYQAAHWGQPNPELGRFDLLIGSDVLYERGQAATLAHFIEAHAEANATVVLVDPNRSERAGFSRLLEAQGFGVEVQLLSAAPGLDEPFHGRLLTFSRGAQ